MTTAKPLSVLCRVHHAIETLSPVPAAVTALKTDTKRALWEEDSTQSASTTRIIIVYSRYCTIIPVAFEPDASANQPASSDQRTTTEKLPTVSRCVYHAIDPLNIDAAAVTSLQTLSDRFSPG